jgi:hypothetical protein
MRILRKGIPGFQSTMNDIYPQSDAGLKIDVNCPMSSRELRWPLLSISAVGNRGFK